MADDRPPQRARSIAARAAGHLHGPITRLMSPSDLGQRLKPFVFLDYIDAPSVAIEGMAIHPHSGIATITLVAEGNLRFDDPANGSGIVGYGGVEWMRAGGGVWHGGELSTGQSERVIGFQLWIALPPELENAPSDGQYLEAGAIPQVGPAKLILGSYDGATSPVRSPHGVNYMLVTLTAGERWTYQPPAGHQVAWCSVAKGGLVASEPVRRGELILFEAGEREIVFEASDAGPAIFVVGSARPHPGELHLGRYSVHGSPEALAAGEKRIAVLAEEIAAAGDRRRASGSIPVYG